MTLIQKTLFNSSPTKEKKRKSQKVNHSIRVSDEIYQELQKMRKNLAHSTHSFITFNYVLNSLLATKKSYDHMKKKKDQVERKLITTIEEENQYLKLMLKQSLKKNQETSPLILQGPSPSSTQIIYHTQSQYHQQCLGQQLYYPLYSTFSTSPPHSPHSSHPPPPIPRNNTSNKLSLNSPPNATKSNAQYFSNKIPHYKEPNTGNIKNDYKKEITQIFKGNILKPSEIIQTTKPKHHLSKINEIDENFFIPLIDQISTAKQFKKSESSMIPG
ncbi:hypothetical protein [Candidatus Harpocratesius sp.]